MLIIVVRIYEFNIVMRKLFYITVVASKEIKNISDRPQILFKLELFTQYYLFGNNSFISLLLHKEKKSKSGGVR